MSSASMSFSSRLIEIPWNPENSSGGWPLPDNPIANFYCSDAFNSPLFLWPGTDSTSSASPSAYFPSVSPKASSLTFYKLAIISFLLQSFLLILAVPPVLENSSFSSWIAFNPDPPSPVSQVPLSGINYPSGPTSPTYMFLSFAIYLSTSMSSISVTPRIFCSRSFSNCCFLCSARVEASVS